MTSQSTRRSFVTLRRENILAVALLATTITLVIGSTVMAARSARANRTLATRALTDFSELAAWNYSFRARSTFINLGWYFSRAVGRIAIAPSGPDVARLNKTADSIAKCKCQVAIKARGFAVGRWHDSSSVRYASVPGQTASNPDGIRAALQYASNTPLRDEDVDMLSGGTGAAVWLLLVVPSHGLNGEPNGFIAVDLDIPFTGQYGFGNAFGGLGSSLFLPQALVGVQRNGDLAEVVVTNVDGAELYRSPRAHVTGFRASVPIEGIKLQVTAELSEAAARGILRGAIPAPDVTIEVALPLLALLLSLAVALALYRAQSLAKARAEFAASVTHELRTPLTQILLNAETLAFERVRDPEERSRFAGAIVREARRLVYLIENVLYFSRADRNMLRLVPRTVRLDRLVVEHLDDLQTLVAASGAHVTVADADAIVAHADPIGLKLVLTNLVDNALHYAPGKEVRISLMQHGPAVDVIVDDAGAGIPQAHRARVLRPFERMGDAHMLHPSGSGIGLAVVNELVRGMGGAVVLEDSPLGGLRVRVQLPSAMAAPQATHVTE